VNLGKVENLKVGKRIKKSVKCASAVTKNAEIFLPLENLIDPEREQKRLQKDIGRYTQLLDKTVKKLSNDDFLKRAPKEIIKKEEAKKEDYRKIIEKLEKNLEAIVGW
jgi:valyl-tRNA synthetase